MSDDRSLCTLLDWDTGFFGIRIGRFGARRLSEATLRQAEQWCADHAVRCLYLLLDADHDATIRLAERHGLHFADIRVTLARTASPVASDGSDSEVRPWRDEDVPVLIHLAGELFFDSRFHMDAAFPPDRASALYREWIRKSCASSDGAVLVAPRDGKPVGFITCDPVASATGRIGLCGVAEEARFRGVGARLVQAAIQWYAERGASRVEVVTQGRNLPAQQLYQRAGFLIQSLELWYHWWIAAAGRRHE